MLWVKITVLDVAQCKEAMPKFQRNLLPPISGYKEQNYTARYVRRRKHSVLWEGQISHYVILLKSLTEDFEIFYRISMKQIHIRHVYYTSNGPFHIRQMKVCTCRSRLTTEAIYQTLRLPTFSVSDIHMWQKQSLYICVYAYATSVNRQNNKRCSPQWFTTQGDTHRTCMSYACNPLTAGGLKYEQVW
jgi:hypothetical protein